MVRETNVVTSSLRRADAGGPFAWEVAIGRAVGGMPRASTAKCAEVYTVFKHDLERRVGSLPPETMLLVDRAPGLVLGLGQRARGNHTVPSSHEAIRSATINVGK